MLAQGGMRTAFRLLSQAASHGRSIHIPTNAFGKKIPGGVSSAKGSKGVVDSARNALVRLLYGQQPLKTNATQPIAFRRGIHYNTSIRNQFSFPTRHALANNPLSFARPPVVQRGVHEVGLGTARKFSTTRPIFQNLIQNVPIAGRSMYEMDLDLQKRKARRIAAKRLALEEESANNGKMAKSERLSFEELNKYFPAVEVSTSEDVSTILTVPLVPFDAPSAPYSSYDEQTFLPYHQTTKTFKTHGKHGQRVSTLFRKLDEARVWDRGAHYEAFGSSSGSINGSRPPSALCTSLRIVFDGWNARSVVDLIGEEGLTWCNIQEQRLLPPLEHVGPFSLDSSRAATPDPICPNVWDQPSDFIMPAMDFSSSFLDQTDARTVHDGAFGFEDVTVMSSGPSTPWFSDISLPSTRPGSVFGDYEVEGDEWRLSQQDTIRPVERNDAHNIAFSAQFVQRSRDLDVWSNF